MSKLIVFLIFNAFLNIYATYQPAYQVMLFAREHSNAEFVQRCNGVIVQYRLILTTATCVHSSLTDNKNSSLRLLSADAIEIVAGISDVMQDAFVAKAAAIHVAEGFNHSTKENDLALISLQTGLPLGLREDIKWIVLDDSGVKNGTGLAYFTYTNCFNRRNERLQMTIVPILNTTVCASNNVTSSRSVWCSFYQQRNKLDCSEVNNFIANYADIGSGLIVENRLIALLTSVEQQQFYRVQRNSDVCALALTKAYYTNIAAHAGWIYELIANEEYIDIVQGNSHMSTPYRTSDLRSISTGKCMAAISTTRNPYLTSSDELQNYDVNDKHSQFLLNSAIKNYANAVTSLICLFSLLFLYLF